MQLGEMYFKQDWPPLNEFGLLVATDYDTLVRNCGPHYLYQRVVGGSLHKLAKFDFANEEEERLFMAAYDRRGMESSLYALDPALVDSGAQTGSYFVVTVMALQGCDRDQVRRAQLQNLTIFQAHILNHDKNITITI